jgi:antitoxin VapB
MPLNVKNEEAHELARQLSELTGTTITEAVTNAIRVTLERERRRRRVRNDHLVQDLSRIAEECASLPVLDGRNPEEILGYDRQGIPS